MPAAPYEALPGDSIIHFAAKWKNQLYNWCHSKAGCEMPPLTLEQMTCFAQWISIGLAERAGVRGRRQKNLMIGPWGAWGPTPKLRGSDFTFRVCLLIEGFHQAGLSVEQAAEMVADLDFVESIPAHTYQFEVGQFARLRLHTSDRLLLPFPEEVAFACFQSAGLVGRL